MGSHYETEFYNVSVTDKIQFVEAIETAISKGGWINVEPIVDDTRRSHNSGIFAWFSARGPEVPIGTFVAPVGRYPASIGVEHGAGRDAVGYLTKAGIAIPESWILRQDHPKRGLVWEISSAELIVATSVAELLLAMTEYFCLLPTEGQWKVAFCNPS
tara:strand:+ start:17 stop:490 length:474 start_codon:yes stop_codon:yes gene_type:complete